MKEVLPYSTEALDFGTQGSPPRNKSIQWPRDAICSRVADQKLQLPEGMTNLHFYFMEDAISSGAIDQINPAYKAVYLKYFTTNSSAKDLSRSLGINSVTAFRRIRYAIRDIWELMPSDIRDEYDPDQIKKLKKMHGARKGFHRTGQEKENLRQQGLERMTLEFRNLIGDAVSDSHTPTVLAKIKKAARRRSNTLEGKERMKSWRGIGHRFTSAESRRISAMRREGEIAEPTMEERHNNPLKGAVFNLNYVRGKGFPDDIKSFFKNNPVISFDWQPRNKDGKLKGTIRYSQGSLFYVKGTLRVQLTPEIIAQIWNGKVPYQLDRDAIERFGEMMKSELRNSLRSRIDSFEAYFQQLHTKQSPNSP
ncbi:MAG: hypothetical protein A3I49_02355 [Candidatus Levybacteria bacterium RIFCSPLOWO2_02_FULL_37_11]|nr:MAG: hypothetical protein A3I49_02355 [Candidatus Levybacteria bacterium RIFCSPLOWO2_02_FULL_37_11]